MATPSRLNLTRDQLASFLQDFEQIKQFERLFATVNSNTNDIIPGVELAAGNSGQAANDALAQIMALAELVALINTASDANSGVASLDQKVDNLAQGFAVQPRAELGTMAPLQQDNIPWLQFNTQPSGYPTGPAANGTVYWDDADAIKTLNIVMEDSGEVIQHVGEETYYRVKASANITEGQVVMFTGTVGASGGLRGAPATGLTSIQSEYIMGVATQNIANNGWGYVTWFGEVKGVNTTGGAEAWVDGQILYYNPAVAGGLTKNVPTAPNPKVIVASVVHAATNGILFVRPTFGSALGATDSNVEITGLANGDLLQYDASQLRWENVPASSASIGTATNIAGGAANRIVYQTAPGTTGFITAPTVGNTFLEWSGSAFQWATNPLGTVTSVSGAGTVNGLTLTGTVTSSGSLTLGGTLSGVSLTSAVTGTLPIANGGTNATTAAGALTSLGAYPASNPSGYTSNTGTVTSVAGTGTVSGLTLSGTVTNSGSLTLGGTLSVAASNFSSQTANTFLAAPNGSAGVPTFRAIVADDIPTLNQSTTGTASNVTGTVAIANGGTGATTASLARTALGATTVGSNLFTLTNPSAITFPRFNANNTVSALSAAAFRTAIGAGTGSGTVTIASVVSANGFAGTVATATTTPAITLTTTITGVLKGNGTEISAATKDVDYIAPSAPVTKTADFTVSNGETWIINNKSGSTCTVTLPSAASFPGRYLTFQNNQDQNLVSASSNVIPQGGGSAGTAILTNVSGNWATLVSNGTNWVIMQAASFNNLLY